jgi:class 3 adenylate cyclase/tetratricopeptide (TPR) repeat protein
VTGQISQPVPDIRFVFALNADVVSYTRLLADAPEATAAAMKRFRNLVGAAIDDAGGSLVNFVGDNFMAVFDSAPDALSAALAISREVAEDNADKLEFERVRFRMGIDAGEMMVNDQNQHLGDVLNIAARIQGIARPGGLSVSSAVYKALDEPAFRFRSVGAKDFKGVPEQVHVYEFADLPATDDTASNPRRVLSLGNPTVAVLPMNMEGLDGDAVAAGRLLLMDLVNGLIAIPSLDVVDVSQTDGHLSDGSAPPSNVRYMLLTGIVGIGTRLRVYATLTEVGAMSNVWVGKWDSTLEEVFDLAERFTADVKRAFEIELVVGAPARIYSDLGDAEGLAKVYEGWYKLNSGSREGWVRGVELFEELVESYPENHLGYGLAAFAHWVGAAQGVSSDPAHSLAMARTRAEQGIEIEDPTGVSHMVLAGVCLAEGDPSQALEQAESALIVRPTCDVTYAMEASVRRYLGQWDEALVLIDHAMDLSPVTKPWYPTVLASSYYIGERYEDAAATADEVVSYQPGNLEALLILAASQSALGLDRRAHATASIIKDRFPQTRRDEWLDSNPYQDTAFVDRWRSDLERAGLS